MPELAEVEFYRKKWEPGIGDPIAEVLVRPKARVFREVSSRSFVRFLKGESLMASHAHGKQMLFEFSGGNWLGVHLGMTGKLTAPTNDDFERAKHDHLVLRCKKRSLVFTDPRMFGKLTLDRGNDFPDWWLALPPAILDREFTKRWVADFVGRFTKSPIKSVLLDQRGFPGIGNWMADEICWRSKIDPAMKCGDLNDGQLAELWKSTRHVSRKAIEIIGTDWKTPPGSWLFTHRWKDGGDCPRKECGAHLIRAELRGRRTCWCPQCQK